MITMSHFHFLISLMFLCHKLTIHRLFLTELDSGNNPRLCVIYPLTDDDETNWTAGVSADNWRVQSTVANDQSCECHLSSCSAQVATLFKQTPTWMAFASKRKSWTHEWLNMSPLDHLAFERSSYLIPWTLNSAQCTCEVAFTINIHSVPVHGDVLTILPQDVGGGALHKGRTGLEDHFTAHLPVDCTLCRDKKKLEPLNGLFIHSTLVKL